MPKNYQEIMNKNEEEKQPLDNHKFSLIKKTLIKPLIKENMAALPNNNNNQIINNIKEKKDNTNFNKRSFQKEINQNNNDINNNLEENIENNMDNNINNENFIDSDTYIIDDNEPLEKPPNALEINDLLGEKCDIDLDILSINFTNYEPSKTSSKTMGVVKAYGANTYI